MYPTSTSVVVSTNKHDDLMIMVSFQIPSGTGLGQKTVCQFSGYSVPSILSRIRASHQTISKLLSGEKVCYPAGEQNSLDDVIEQLLCIEFMVGESGLPFSPDLFKSRFRVGFPYAADHTTRHIVREYLLRAIV